jgi:hypothetical protein
VNSYKSAGATCIFAQPFGVVPVLHNPLHQPAQKIEKVAFAGAWYSNFPDRQAATKMLFQAVLNAKFPLEIIDRRSNRTEYPDEKHRYPTPWGNYTVPSMPYQQVMEGWLVGLSLAGSGSHLWVHSVQGLSVVPQPKHCNELI